MNTAPLRLSATGKLQAKIFVKIFLLSYGNYARIGFNYYNALKGSSTFHPDLQKTAGGCEAADRTRELTPEHFPEPGVFPSRQ